MNKEICGWYIGMSAGERVDYIYMNFRNIMRILSSQQEALAMRVSILRESSAHKGYEQNGKNSRAVWNIGREKMLEDYIFQY